MNSDEFRQAAKQLTDYIADYCEGLRTRSVIPDVEPGYLNELVPETIPEHGEPWIKIFNDIEPIIMKGVSFHFHFIYFLFIYFFQYQFIPLKLQFNMKSEKNNWIIPVHYSLYNEHQELRF
ncbi:hypothetical protein BLA29_011016 [Euroglyphus maynei]|uniref:Uncharacterized protein n=1 Tax=Euroglyphus maynei TaxID=6958 RepID=A0A1Y3B8S6_EURMA|nr:hypothetical protein BLA29_011016 [Euroglyphus maynei]